MADKKVEEALKKLGDKLRGSPKKTIGKDAKRKEEKVTEKEKSVEIVNEEAENVFARNTAPSFLSNTTTSQFGFGEVIPQQSFNGQLEQAIANVETKKDDKKEERLYSEARDLYEDSQTNSSPNRIMAVPQRGENDFARPALMGGIENRRIGMVRTENMGDGGRGEIYEVHRISNSPQDLFDLNANNKIRKYQQ